ncbi:TorF family putative porin [Xanthobacter sp. V2C-8]|uniref:TorF family putative porin n=1 Tax=Xanthobacter albus TaxID=3119929 RepID=UPI00372C572E
MGVVMRRIAISILASVLLAGAASAADLSSVPVKAPEGPSTPVWDVSFGVTGTTDYVFRGISQTKGNAAIQGFAELSLFDWIYAGVWGSNVSFPGSGSMELDVYGGLRNTWGPLTVDVGILGFLYPGSDAGSSINAWEVHFKPTYDVTNWLNVGAFIYYTSDYAATGTDGTYLGGTVKITLPNFGPENAIGWFLSGEYGYQWLDHGFWTSAFTSPWTGATYYVDIPGYNNWSVGLGLTYKAATLDLRYYGTDLSGDQCVMLIGDSSSCGNRYVASLSFATAFSALK